MNEKIVEIKNKYNSMMGVVANHLLKIGLDTAASITDKDLEDIKAKIQKEEKEAEAKGQFRIITAEFSCFILEGCRDLAKLCLSEGSNPASQEALLLVAQSLVSEKKYLGNAEFEAIQKEYWQRIAKQIIEGQSCQERRDEPFDEDDYEEIADRIVGDDEVWEAIDEAIKDFVREQ